MRISDWSSDVCSSDLDRLSVAPIQYEYLTAFGRLEQCGNGAFWSRQIHQRWLRGDIIVPQIMVRRLKGPAHGPAFRIQRNYRTRIAIVQCGSMTAIIVRCSISRRYEDEASILVRAHRCPTVGAAGRITLSLGRCAATVGMADVEGPCKRSEEHT